MEINPEMIGLTQDNPSVAEAVEEVDFQTEIHLNELKVNPAVPLSCLRRRKLNGVQRVDVSAVVRLDTSHRIAAR